MQAKIIEKTDKKVVFKLENGNILTLLPVREDVVRVTVNREETETATETSTIIMQDVFLHAPKFQHIELIHEQNRLEVETKDIMVSVRLSDGQLMMTKKEDNQVLFTGGNTEISGFTVMKYSTDGEDPVIERRKTVDGERNFIKNLKEIPDHNAYRAKVFFDFAENEGVYGLGQAEEGIYNYRGKHQYLYQHNMRIPMPVFYSDKGYGILFDCLSLMTFQDDCDGSYLFMDAVNQVDFYLLAGGKPDGVIDGIRYLTGKAAMLPKWAYGYIQSKEQYYTAKELRDVVKKYRELQVPIDCVVQDWNTWESGNWGEKLVDKSRYGDLKERMEEIKEMHAHAMVSVWPNMNTGGKNHTELFQAGYMLNDYSTYDAFNEKAREMYWKQAKEDLFDGGFEAWWCDSTEPFSGPDWGGEVKREPWERFTMVGNEHKKYLPQEKTNAYALMHAKGIFENQRKTTEKIRVLNLTRSGYASGQKYAAMLWSGDTYASYDILKKQITEGLNMGLSGYPYWTLDIGGFFTVRDKWQNRGCGCNQDPTPKWFWQGDYNEGVNDKAYCELYVRWLQMGTFLPMFRSHGTDTPREIWNFGKKGEMFYDAIENFIQIRYRLMPYIYSLAGAVRLQNDTIMRSLLFDFAADKRARDIHNEFMFGRNVLVCPVTEAMYYEPDNHQIDREKKWNCYLPKGADWYDFFTNEQYEGGKEYTVAAGIDRIPVFIKAGSIVPMKTGMQYAEDQESAPMELHIYPGQDAQFCIYEDEGNNYNYENGDYSTIELTWKQAEQKVIIGKRKGQYPGIQKERSFILYIKDKKCEEIHYTGDEITALILYNPKD